MLYNLASGQRAIWVMSMTSKRAERLKESRWCLMVRWWKSQTQGTIFGCTSCWMCTRKTVAGCEEHPLCRGSDRLHYSPHNHITQRIREHLPMKDFFPVFMSSSLWWKGVCLLHGVQVTESTKKDVVLLFKNEAPLPFSVFSVCLSVVFFFLNRWLSLRLWSEKSSIHRQITLTQLHFPLLFLPLKGSACAHSE